MLTKSQVCWMVVNNHFKGRKIDDTEILQSSTLAVAMEYLDLIKTKLYQDYAKSRGGVLMVGNVSAPNQSHEIKTLSFRDILSLLPD